MLISKIKDVASVNSAIKHTKYEAMHLRKFSMRLRIDGAHTEALPANNPDKTINKDTPYSNGGIWIITSVTTSEKIIITDTQTKQRQLYPDDISIFAIWNKPPRLHKTITNGFMYFLAQTNEHSSKRHYYEKQIDYYTASNSTWRIMEQPHYLRGIDFSRPDLW